MDLAEIQNVSIFSEQLGSRFQIENNKNQFVAAQLTEAEALRSSAGNSRSAGRESFSLLFEIDGDIDLPQRIYTVHHEQLGELPLFLVPVGPGKMESIFN